MQERELQRISKAMSSDERHNIKDKVFIDQFLAALMQQAV